MADQTTRANTAANLIGLSGNTSLNSNNILSQINSGMTNNTSAISNLMAQIKAGKNADTALTANIMNGNASTANQNYTGLMGYYNAANSNKLADWEVKQKISSSYASAGSNLAGGLMYLYGQNKGGGAKTPTPSASNGW